MDLIDNLAHGDVLSAAAARRAGIAAEAIARHRRSGRLVRLTRGWYAVRPPRDDHDRHRLTASALGREYSGRALVSHHSALVLLDLPTYDVDLSIVHLTRVCLGVDGRPSRIASRRAGLILHQPVSGLVPPEGAFFSGLHSAAYVPTEVAVVQAGLTGSPLSSLVAADAALHRGMVTPRDLDAAAGALAGRAGIGPVRAALRQADGRIESPGETLTGFVVRGMGLELEPQFEVLAEGRRYRADFRIKGTRVLLEFDGQVKYASGDPGVLFEEKRREDALRRAGWIVVRLVWADLKHPATLHRRIREALRLAA
jgi:hypothetical protein